MQVKRTGIVALSSFYIIALLVIGELLLYKDNRESSRNKRSIFTRTNPGNETDLPLIFVGGVPSSGTTLMRSMLDAHPDIRCSPETRLLSWLMLELKEWHRGEDETHRLAEAGVVPYVLDTAVTKFMLQIIKHHSTPKSFFCNKDPLLLLDMIYLKKLFRNAKFIYMVRDGRANAHSLVSRNVTILGVEPTSYRTMLQFWNRASLQMYASCNVLGEAVCLPVHYEKLVLQPVQTTKKIFEFLDIDWNPEVLHHERHVKETLSQFEFLTDQVKKPIYLDALTSWFGKIPLDVERDMAKIAPMLKILGYDPNNREPNYGEPDDFVSGIVKY